jgi:hypothetical protein
MSSVVSAAICRLLAYRGQYTPCHIEVPDVEGKLAAVAVDGRYFSLFRRFDDAEKVMKVAAKLAQRGDDLALTASAQGYVVWVYEPEAKELPAANAENRMHLPTYGPAPCFIICDTTHYRPCYIKVPDLPKYLVAVYYAKRFYSVYRRGLKAEEVLEMATQLVGRGDEVAIAPTKQGYALCVWEPEAVPYNPQKPVAAAPAAT